MAFENDELIQSWVVRHLQIIGEAVRGLSASFCAAHPEVEWRKIVGMRNILVHDYLGIDIALVWSVVENDLPVLREQVRQILEP